MEKEKDLVNFFYTKISHKPVRVDRHVCKLVYLADWKSSLDRGVQITGLIWKKADGCLFAEFPEGGFLMNVKFEKKEILSFFKKEEMQILHHVLETSEKYQNDIRKIWASTYPVMSTPDYVVLDLPELAGEYRKMKKEMGRL